MTLFTFVISTMINKVPEMEERNRKKKKRTGDRFSPGIMTFILAISSIPDIFRYFLVALVSPLIC